jgi:CRP-like cAMP-binding protein
MAILNLFQFVKDFQSFKAGETIYKQGEMGDRLYVVIEGDIDLSYNGRHLETVSPGGIIGEISLVDDDTDEGQASTAIAKTDCKVVPVDRQRFTFMVHETPYFALEVMEVLAERLRKERARV